MQKNAFFFLFVLFFCSFKESGSNFDTSAAVVAYVGCDDDRPSNGICQLLFFFLLVVITKYVEYHTFLCIKQLKMTAFRLYILFVSF